MSGHKRGVLLPESISGGAPGRFSDLPGLIMLGVRPEVRDVKFGGWAPQYGEGRLVGHECEIELTVAIMVTTKRTGLSRDGGCVAIPNISQGEVPAPPTSPSVAGDDRRVR